MRKTFTSSLPYGQTATTLQLPQFRLGIRQSMWPHSAILWMCVAICHQCLPSTLMPQLWPHCVECADGFALSLLRRCGSLSSTKHGMSSAPRGERVHRAGRGEMCTTCVRSPDICSPMHVPTSCQCLPHRSLMAAVLSVPPEGLVLEPSMFAHALSRPQKPSTADEEHTSLARYSYVGGNFGIPHRDHSSTDCFGEHALSGLPA